MKTDKTGVYFNLDIEDMYIIRDALEAMREGFTSVKAYDLYYRFTSTIHNLEKEDDSTRQSVSHWGLHEV